MIEAFFVDDDANVRKPVEENQVAELELFAFRGRAERRPVRARRSTLKIYPDVLEGAPHQTGAIKFLWPGAIEVISRAYVRFERGEQVLMKAAVDGARFTQQHRHAVTRVHNISISAIPFGRDAGSRVNRVSRPIIRIVSLGDCGGAQR